MQVVPEQTPLPHPQFERLIESFLQTDVGITDFFLDENLCNSLKDSLLAKNQNNQLQTAGTGNSLFVSYDKEVRGDKICWIEKTHEDNSENEFLKVIDTLVQYLNETCFAGIQGYEFHFTLYQPGSYYRKHLDQFKNDSSRAFTVIIYLNSDWKQGDGGELCVYNRSGKQIIEPLFNRCVFFKSSELAHEVLITNQPRLSITGWLKRN